MNEPVKVMDTLNTGEVLMTSAVAPDGVTYIIVAGPTGVAITPSVKAQIEATEAAKSPAVP